MKVVVQFSEIDKKFKVKAGLEREIDRLARQEKKTLEEIAIIFTSNNKLLEINKKFLNHNYFTDIITFNNCKRNLLIGELYISLEQVEINAKTLNLPFEDEVLRVIIHGILHMVGYNDETEDQKHVMRKKEDSYLCNFRNADSIES